MSDGVVLEWRDPPEGTSYPDIVGALKQRPGKWALVFGVPTREQAKTRGQSIRRAARKIDIPVEVTVRQSPWGEPKAFHVYAGTQHMTPADLARAAVQNLEIAQTGFLEDDQDGARTAALISIAASLIRLSAPSSIEFRRARLSTEYDVDEMLQDRQEVWADQQDRQRRDLRDARD